MRGHPAAAVLLALALCVLPRHAAARSDQGFPSLGGPTGLINVPVPEILEDASFRFGYARIDRRWTYQLRGRMDNDVWYFAVGFLPRTEVMIRATIFPDETMLENVNEPNVDRMASARFLVNREGRWPGLAVGLDDPRGTRRFHSLYVVADKTVIGSKRGARLVAVAGYGSDLLDARRYVLDGFFGGLEARPAPGLSTVLEYDTEKWNTGVRLSFFNRLTVSAALLDLEVLSGGAAWTQRF